MESYAHSTHGRQEREVNVKFRKTAQGLREMVKCFLCKPEEMRLFLIFSFSF